MRTDLVREQDQKRRLKILAQVRDQPLSEIVGDIIEEYFQHNQVDIQEEIMEFFRDEQNPN